MGKTFTCVIGPDGLDEKDFTTLIEDIDAELEDTDRDMLDDVEIAIIREKLKNG